MESLFFIEPYKTALKIFLDNNGYDRVSYKKSIIDY